MIGFFVKMALFGALMATAFYVATAVVAHLAVKWLA
jgi:hypothetical protein